MRAFQPKGYTCMHLHSKTPNQTDIQDGTVRYYIYISHPPVLFWHMPQCLSRQQITIQDISMKYGQFKGIMMDQYFTHLYSYVHTSVLTFFLISTHFTVCITIHTVCRLRWYCSSIRVLKIVYFFLLLAVSCVLNAKYLSFNSWSSPPCQNLRLSFPCLGGPF